MKDDDFKQALTKEQYRVLRERGTEPPFSGKLLDNTKDGNYYCAACNQLVFKSDTKYDSGTGWPSFTQTADNKSVILHHDLSHGMYRTEVNCANCGSHLGHLFQVSDTPTGQDYCINSLALEFKPREI